MYVCIYIYIYVRELEEVSLVKPQKFTYSMHTKLSFNSCDNGYKHGEQIVMF